MTINSNNILATTTVPTPPVTPAPDPIAGVQLLGTIAVTKAVKQDAPAMATIGGATFTATFGHSVSKEDLEEFLTTTYSAEAVAAEFAEPKKTWLAAKTSGGKVVGIAQLLRGATHSSIDAPANEVAEMQKVYVDASVHGQGIGSKLISAVEQLAREEGLTQLWLTVWEENLKAQKLYNRLGYKKTGEIDFATGTCIQTDHVLVKHL
ncbi:acyl-CoA N-acyltransferase [Truncatella angustata]|uniref:Acyl-CoA N-acyltransferase n=1 Tax=Truncatella angustata TaxID=152316 RepID=A0A9P8UXJ5_9PEZI|nr:acyl-CoA N-acyltransferase [Truncatella angustata]KAH6660205.1 acyl-CoA N-acyltransferase [Truncatella angustata]